MPPKKSVGVLKCFQRRPCAWPASGEGETVRLTGICHNLYLKNLRFDIPRAFPILKRPLPLEQWKILALQLEQNSHLLTERELSLRLMPHALPLVQGLCESDRIFRHRRESAR